MEKFWALALRQNETCITPTHSESFRKLWNRFSRPLYSTRRWRGGGEAGRRGGGEAGRRGRDKQATLDICAEFVEYNFRYVGRGDVGRGDSGTRGRDKQATLDICAEFVEYNFRWSLWWSEASRPRVLRLQVPASRVSESHLLRPQVLRPRVPTSWSPHILESPHPGVPTPLESPRPWSPHAPGVPTPLESPRPWSGQQLI